MKISSPRHSHSGSASGFSLVELSIVLVILGLLVGGVLSGQALIQSAELRSIITDRDKYTAAFNTFKAKYNSLPGDFPRATSIWGAVDPTPATCKATGRTSFATCNGNGDGIIQIDNEGGIVNVEQTLTWEHLSLSKIIEGAYVGYAAGATDNNTYLSGTTAPKARYKEGGWSVMSSAYLTTAGSNGTAAMWKGKYSHNLYLARRTSTYNNDFGGTNLLTPEDAGNIDTKADDGKPGTGSIRTQENGNGAGTCTSSVTYTDYFTATYATATAPGCRLLFDMGL